MAEQSRWEVRGRHRVVNHEVSDWDVSPGEQMAVFAQVPEPTPPGDVPVVVFSHGLGGSHRGYGGLGAHLASHGAAVLHPQFRDSRSRPGSVKERAAIRPFLFDPADWSSRLARIRAVLGSLADQCRIPIRLQPEGVVLAGHSYGAFVTQLLLGVRLSGIGAEIDTTAHPAVCGGILLSPQGSGDRGLTASSWDDVTKPVLVVTATHDHGARGEGLGWRREPFDRARSDLKHLAVVRGGDHHLGGIPMPGDDWPSRGGGQAWKAEVRNAVAAVTLAFMAWIRGERDAGEWLRSRPLGAVLDHCHVELLP